MDPTPAYNSATGGAVELAAVNVEAGSVEYSDNPDKNEEVQPKKIREMTAEELDCAIEWENRPPQSPFELFCAVLFYLCCALLVISFIVVFAAGNKKMVTGNCPLNSSDPHACLDDACGDDYYWNPYEVPSSAYASGSNLRDIPCIHKDLYEELRKSPCARRALSEAGAVSNDGGEFQENDGARQLVSSGGAVSSGSSSEHSHDIMRQIGLSTLAHAVNYLQNEKSLNPHVEPKLTRAVRRRLSSSSKNDQTSVWESMGDHWHVPCVLFLAFAFVTIGYAYALYKVPNAIIFGSIAIGALGFPVVLVIVSEGVLWIILVPGVAVCGIAIYYYKSIMEAADAASNAILCLASAADVLLMSTLQLLIFGSFLAIWLSAFIETGNWVEVDTSSGMSLALGSTGQSLNMKCSLVTSEGAKAFQWILFAVFMPLTMFLKQVLLIICTCGVGKWYFHDPAHEDDEHHYAGPAPEAPAQRGFVWSYTSMCGMNMFVAIISTILNEIKSRADRIKQQPWMLCCCCCAPIDIVSLGLWLCMGQCVESFSKYLVIGHTFTGGGICAISRKVWKVLNADEEKSGGGFVVQDQVLSNVFSLHSTTLAVAFGMLGWVWMDNAMEHGIFGDEKLNISIFIEFLLIFLMYLFVTGFGFGPIFGLILTILIADWDTVNDLDKKGVLHGFYTGCFIGCSCCIGFCFVQQLIMYATNAVLYCLALVKRANASIHFGKRASAHSLVIHTDELEAAGGKIAMKPVASVGHEVVDPHTGMTMVAHDTQFVNGVPVPLWKPKEKEV
ncbi:unnamed protein product [Amoebophrya sp. A25]|nr:unnamed protein product [Amoebophrya sp. A25]|eukprot:GSA25T00024943001.1